MRFRHASGPDVLYWSGKLSDRNRKARNFLGHGTPGATEALTIGVQFNLPVQKFSRAFGGAFLRDTRNRIVLAHNGIVTLGHGRVPKDKLFSVMMATVREATTSAGPSNFLLISELESQNLIEDLDGFSTELRRAAREIKLSPSKRQLGTTGRRVARQPLSGKLRRYFDEFSGKKQIHERPESIADCYHGTIVRAIRDAIGGSAVALKSQAIDLTVISKTKVYLFEVKTSSTPQAVYTAIGQLTAHAPGVSRYALAKTLVKVIVLPEPPNRRLQNVLVGHLDIRLLTFTRSADGRVLINGLQHLAK